MSYAPNFELVSELQTLNRRDFPLDGASAANNLISLDPNNARPLIEGEWVRLTANYALERGGDNNASTADIETSANVFVVHTERGRYDVQAIQKVNVLFFGMYEADTLVVDQTGPLAVGDELMVRDITYLGAVRRGLYKADATAARVVVGIVTKITGSKVRFLHMANTKRTANG